jgi:UDP-2-acetamido-3-amino-2,3-dideoxy-glucuronate N-acetyltransferase
MSLLAGIMIDTLPTMRDSRGALTVADFAKAIPFPVTRLFYVWDVAAGTQRGRHAHRRCSQYMICVTGRIEIELADTLAQRQLELAPGTGVLVPPGIFAAETYCDPGTVLLVLCDRPYEKDDYIHSMDELRSTQS